MNRHKKLFAVLTLVCFLFTLMPVTAFAENAEITSGTCGKNATWSFDAEIGTLTISGSGAMYDYWYGATNAPWHDNCAPQHEGTCQKIKHVVIGEGITSIGGYAFSMCNQLKSVSIANTVQEIKGFAFGFSDKLQDINIPASVTNIDPLAFEQCIILNNITVDDNNEYYTDCDGVLYNIDMTELIIYPAKKSGEKFSIPNGVKRINEYAFSVADNDQITELYVPETVIELFEDCWSHSMSALSQITVSENNQYYAAENGVLYNKEMSTLLCYPSCKTDKEYEIPVGVQKIERDTMTNRIYLERIVLPETLKSIGYNAFRSCTQLKSINIPDGVTEIGGGAFYRCTSLQTVSLPKSLKYLGTTEAEWDGPDMIDVFGKCTALTDVYYAGTEEEWNKIVKGYSAGEDINESLQNVKIHFNTTVTNNPVSLEKSYVEIPEMDYTSESSHSGTRLLVKLNDMNNNPTIASSNDVHFWVKKDGEIKYMPYFYANSWNDSSFYTNSKLKCFGIRNAKYGDSVSIYFYEPGTYTIYYSFDEPKSINNEITAENVISKTITIQDNHNCGTDATWSLENGVLTISGTGQVTKNSWEVYSEKIKTVVITEGIAGIKEDAFAFMQAVEQFIVYEGNPAYAVIDDVLYNKDITKLVAYPIAKNSASYIMPESVKTIEGFALYDANIEFLQISKNLESSSNELCNIEQLNNLSAIQVTSGNENFSVIDGVLFDSTGEILYIYPPKRSNVNYVIPEGTKYIFTPAFWDAMSLKMITIPTSVESLFYQVEEVNYNEVVWGMSNSLDSISVSENNQYYSSLDGALFDKEKTRLIICPASKNLTKYVVPNGVEIIEENAFYKSSLQELVIPATVKDINDLMIAYNAENLIRIIVDEGNVDYYSIDGILYEYGENGDKLIAYPNNRIGTKYLVPDKIVEIQEHAFIGNNNLEELVLCEGVISIGEGAFENCDQLKAIYIPDSVTEFGWHMLMDSNNLTDIYFGGTEEQWNTLNGDGKVNTDGITVHFNSIGIPSDSNTDNNTSSGSTSSGGGSYYVPSTNQSSDDITINNTNSNISVETSEIKASVISDAKQAVSKDSNTEIIGGADCAVNISAEDKQGNDVNAFFTPLTVEIPVSSAVLKSVDNLSHLTLAKVVTDENGNTSLVYMGGNYDTQSGLFTAYVDEPGDCVLMEDADVKKIELQIGSRATAINGTDKTSDVAPRIIDNHTYVPLRFIAEMLGCEVAWDEETRTVTITQNGITMKLVIDEKIAGYDVAAVIRENRTLVPLRYIAEQLGANVIWHPQTQEIVVVK